MLFLVAASRSTAFNQFDWQAAKKARNLASSFDKLGMRLSVFNGLDLMVSLSRFGGLTVRPWAASFFSLLGAFSGLAAQAESR
jgi:hypothetical protein